MVADVCLHLFDNGLTREECRCFVGHGLGDRIIMGDDVYERNGQIVLPGGEIRPAGEVFGWSAITRQYDGRYHRPVMHTETNDPDVETAQVRLAPAEVDGWAERYPARVIVGEGVTLEGTLGHFKGFADLWQADHLWDMVVAARGRPTFMIGRAEDPELERHLAEGAYVVIDDVALARYRDDPRVTCIPGSPVGNEMMPAIMAALGVELPGRAVEGMLKAWQALQARWRGGR